MKNARNSTTHSTTGLHKLLLRQFFVVVADGKSHFRNVNCNLMPRQRRASKRASTSIFHKPVSCGSHVIFSLGIMQGFPSHVLLASTDITEHLQSHPPKPFSRNLFFLALHCVSKLSSRALTEVANSHQI